MCDSLDLNDCFDAVVQIAKEAGEVIRTAFSAEKHVKTKVGFADLVTETDMNIEAMIFRALGERYPKHMFVGEESTSEGTHVNLTDDPTWVIDPIDGTTNFVHRFPHIAVSIALLIKKQTVMGVVYNPILEQLYWARPGLGAFCNNQRLHVTDTSRLQDALVCVEFGSSRDPSILDAKFRSMRNVVEQARGMRCIGSAALHMCMVAAGELDAHFTYGIHIWDMAAGDIIVREAGGVVIDTSGGALDLMGRQVLCASSEKLAKQIAANIERIEMERD